MIPRCILFCALLLVPTLPSMATTDVVHLGHNIVLPAEQRFHDATCVLCSVVVDGRGSGSVRVFAGNVVLNGSVAGRVLVLGGNVTLTRDGTVGDRVIIFGGHLQQDTEGRGPARIVLPPIVFLPLIFFLCIVTGGLIMLTQRMVREPVSYPPLPRL